MTIPLSHLHVLDLTRVLAGSWATQLLADMYAGTAVLAALEHRHVSGRGQHIDLALFDCVVGLNSYQALNYFLSGKTPPRIGNAHRTRSDGLRRRARRSAFELGSPPRMRGGGFSDRC
jgi:crotonobetainyl-CoA:carnitine CoA-transferase CaiB-like acyl-CoA transferase